MLKKSFLAFSLISLFSAISAVSGSPTVIAVLDSPVDYDHPEIQAVLDEGLLKNAKIIDELGNEKSWYDLNLEAKAEFEKRLNRKVYDEQVRFIDAMHTLMGGDFDSNKKMNLRATVIKGYIKYLFSPKYRSGLNVVGTYLHGTHVAGIAIESLTNVRLINFPIITSAPEKKLTLTEIFKFDPIKQRRELRNQLEQISQVLQKDNVRVVNLSIGTSDEIAFKLLKQKATILQKIFFRGQLKELAKQNAKVFTEELAFFFRANPNSVFVLAAGNEKQNLAKTTDHSANIQTENLIKVGALYTSNNLASFSNRSASYVDIAAFGTGIVSALVGGGKMHMSGTSQAAPNVTNALAQIFEAAPQISAKEAIDALLEQGTRKSTALDGLVVNGRVLSQPRLFNLVRNVRTENGIPEVLVDLENTSGSRFSKLILEKTQQVIGQNLPELNVIVTEGRNRTANLNFKNNNGAVEVIITSFFQDEKFTQRFHAPGAASCKDVFM